MRAEEVAAIRTVVEVVKHDAAHPDGYDPSPSVRAQWEAARLVLGTKRCATAATSARIALGLAL